MVILDMVRCCRFGCLVVFVLLWWGVSRLSSVLVCYGRDVWQEGGVLFNGRLKGSVGSDNSQPIFFFLFC